MYVLQFCNSIAAFSIISNYDKFLIKNDPEVACADHVLHARDHFLIPAVMY